MADPRPARAGAAAAGPGVGSCTVLHVDMDAFFAAVEVLDDPSLAGRPVIVGGTGRRGVVAACTYEARAFGVHSAMPSLEARRRCPEAVFLAGRFARYTEVSRQLHEILQRFTPVVEPLALDEAFLDVSGATRIFGPPSDVAAAIRRTVSDELHLRCAVGVARNKLLAKLASRAAKPVVTPQGPRPGPGVVVVEPAGELEFLHPLPIRALWGVGPATAARLDRIGVVTVGDLATVPAETLRRLVGPAAGHQLAELAQGRDPRPVIAARDAKSIGHEETFADDLDRHDVLHRHLVRMADAVSARLGEAGRSARTVSVKVRFADLSYTTRSHTSPTPLQSARTLTEIASSLLGDVDVSPGVRLLGVTASALQPADAGSVRQLTFADAAGPDHADPAPGRSGSRGTATPTAGPPAVPDADPARRPASPDLDPGRRAASLDAAVASVRARYGHRSVGAATLVGPSGLDVKGRGDTQWGPGGPDAAAGDAP